MNKKLQEIIDYLKLESEESYDKKEIITNIIEEIKELKCKYSDEIGLEWDKEVLITLDDFSEQFFDKLIIQICNVLKSFQDE